MEMQITRVVTKKVDVRTLGELIPYIDKARILVAKEDDNLPYDYNANYRELAYYSRSMCESNDFNREYKLYRKYVMWEVVGYDYGYDIDDLEVIVRKS